MRRWFARLLPAALLLLCSCGSDEAASGSVVGPTTGPRVDESVLAQDVLNGAPVGITSIFDRNEIVHLWVRWANLVPPHSASAVWYGPSGSEVANTTVPLDTGPSNQVTEFLLDLTPSSALGRWEVVLFLDGVLQRSHLFDVIDVP